MSKFLVTYGKPRYFGIVLTDTELKYGDVIVSQTIRGEELSTVICPLTDELEQSYRGMFRSLEHNEGMAKAQEPLVTDVQFVSYASQEDLEEAAFHRKEEPQWLKIAKEILADQDIEMKLVDIECLRCEKKIYFYFSAEGRVDFRNFVKDLAHEFKMRIELRQLSTRDSARDVGGIAPCGHTCCCNYWLNQFSPIPIKMIKEQNLALNPAKISGLCGKLMCCMCFEHSTYHEAWQDFPQQGTKFKMPDGRSVVVTGIDLKANKVRFSVPDKGDVLVAKEELENVTRAIIAGEDWKTEDEQAKLDAIKQNLVSFAEIEVTKKSDNKGKQDKDSTNNAKQQKKNKAHQNDKNSSKKHNIRRYNKSDSDSQDDLNIDSGKMVKKRGRRITFRRK